METGTGYGYNSTGDLVPYAGHGYIFLQWNGEDVATGYSRIFGATLDTRLDTWTVTYATLSVHGTLKLNQGGTITICHGGGTIYIF